MKKELCVIAIAMSATSIAHATEQTYVPPTTSTLSRAEVRQDLVAWDTSGLADMSRGQLTPDIHSTEYRDKLAIYQRSVERQQADDRRLRKF